MGVAPDALTALAVATDQACQTLADLLRATAGGGLTDRPRLVLTHTGALLVLTDLPTLCRADRAGTGLTTPWPTGETSAANLTGYCTSHHRGKHQAPGWRHQMAPDGTLTVTTPTGLVAATTPPPY